MRIANLLIIWALALVGVSLGEQCLPSQASATYTECLNGMRNVIYFWPPDINCDPTGVPLPPNIFTLPCDIACGEGWYLPVGDTKCAPCDAGSYSIGGGQIISGDHHDWRDSLFDQSALQKINFHRRCLVTETNQPATDCTDIWTPDLNGTRLFSGTSLQDSRTAVLDLPLWLLVDGHVHFSYTVSSERSYDFFKFRVDNTEMVSFSGTTDGVQEFKYNLTAGYHQLQWIYSKDYSVSRGEDGAGLGFVEIGGIDYADRECISCPMGFFQNEMAQESCLPCPLNTFSNETGLSQCFSCDAEEFSYVQSTGCTPREPCVCDSLTAGKCDYHTAYGMCMMDSLSGNLTRNREFVWNEPMVCSSTTGVSLPPTETDLPCRVCPAGEFRDSTTFQCVACPSGRYSQNPNSEMCEPCPAGTEPVRKFVINEWPQIPSAFQSSCSGECSGGWRALNDFVDSGVGHGASVTNTLILDLDVVHMPINVEFDFDFADCGNLPNCYLTVAEVATDYQRSWSSFFSSGTVHVSFTLPASSSATRQLRLIFDKYSYFTSVPQGRVRIYSFSVEGTTLGGAASCQPCENGQISSEGDETCHKCPAGQTANEMHTECINCPENFFNDEVGSTCFPCPPNTVSRSGSTECDAHMCTADFGEGVMYDLAPLGALGSLGPIRDEHEEHMYFISLCHRTNQSCHNDFGLTEEVNAFACQQLDDGRAFSLGRAVGFSPRPNAPSDEGLIVDFLYGDRCGNGAHRNATVVLICDPSVPVGQPHEPLFAPIEDDTGAICQYNFAWESLYACPVCSSRDYASARGPCGPDGMQTETFYWVNNPKRCHDGVSLPETRQVACSTNGGASCPAGQQSTTNSGADSCEPCARGYFSIGGGVQFTNWTALPPGFISATWVPHTHFIAPTGLRRDDSRPADLQIQADFATTGTLEVELEAFGTSSSGTRTVQILDGLTVRAEARTVALARTVLRVENLAPGEHLLTVRYNQGKDTDTPAPVPNVFRVTLLGVTQSSSCQPCPPGTFANTTGNPECTNCPAGSFSSGGAEACTPCPAGTFSLPGSEQCVQQMACTLEKDYAISYGACTRDVLTMSRTYTLLGNPARCEPPLPSIPSLSAIECSACPPGTIRNPNTGECDPCAAGEHYDLASKTCSTTMPGTQDSRYWYTLWNRGTTSLPATGPIRFSTGCVGHCTGGWRVREGIANSGNVTADGSDGDSTTTRWLRMDVDIVEADDGGIAFEATLGTSQRFTFFVDGVATPLVAGGDSQHIPLRPGLHELIWAVTRDADNSDEGRQPESITPATLRAIVVSGAGIGGTLNAPCAAGTYSRGVGNLACTPCERGMFCNSTGCAQCSSCPENTAARSMGSSECTACGTGSFAPEGAHVCSSDCMWSVTSEAQGTFVYNLTGAPVPLGPLGDAAGREILLSLCTPEFEPHSLCADKTGAPVDTHICVHDSNNGIGENFGDTLHFAPLSDSPRAGFSLSYTGPSDPQCPGMPARSTQLTMICDPEAASSLPTVLPNSSCGALGLIWRSALACPICDTQRDYRLIESGCSNGARTSYYVRITDCQGAATLDAGSSDCADVAVNWVVLLVLLVFAVVCACAVIGLVWWNRRITGDYRRLEEEFSEKHIELNKVGEQKLDDDD